MLALCRGDSQWLRPGRIVSEGVRTPLELLRSVPIEATSMAGSGSEKRMRGVTHPRPQSGRAHGEGSAVHLYCLVPPDLPELHHVLSRHFRDDPSVEVVRERRSGERRSGAERSRGDGEALRGADRRWLHRPVDRRVDERRAILTAAEQRPPLPEEVAAHADRLTFVEVQEQEDAPAPTQRPYLREQVKKLEARAVQREAEIAALRKRCVAAEGEVEELLGSLVRAAQDLRELRRLSPRWYCAVTRASQAIERHRVRRLSKHG